MKRGFIRIAALALTPVLLSDGAIPPSCSAVSSFPLSSFNSSQFETQGLGTAELSFTHERIGPAGFPVSGDLHVFTEGGSGQSALGIPGIVNGSASSINEVPQYSATIAAVGLNGGTDWSELYGDRPAIWQEGRDFLNETQSNLYGKTLFHVSPGIKPSPEFLNLFTDKTNRIRVANGHQTGGLEPLVPEELLKLTEMGMNGIGVTLLYHKAPMQQPNGEVHLETIDYSEAKEKGRLIQIGTLEVPIEGRHEKVAVWAAPQFSESGDNAVVLYLDHPEIPNQIYPKDDEQRMRQMLLLGRGTLALIKSLNEPSMGIDWSKLAALGLPFPDIDPAIVQMNEALAAFAHPDTIDDEFTQDVDLHKPVYGFTTHTPVEVGLQKVPWDLADRIRLNPHRRHEIVRDGKLDLTTLIFLLADVSNAVSREHARVTEKLYPQFKGLVKGIVNGIYLPHWQLEAMAKLVDAEYNEQNVQTMLETHAAAKKRLAAFIAENSGLQPDETKLFSVEARRKTDFKAVDSFVETMTSKRMRDDFLKSEVIQIFTGKQHPSDAWGKARVRELRALAEGRVIRVDENTGIEHEVAKDARLIGRVFFLTNFNVDEAPILFQGADVMCMWSQLETEASATGYMKGLVNAVISWVTGTGGPLEHIRDINNLEGEPANGAIISDYKNQRPTPAGIINAVKVLSGTYKQGRSRSLKGHWDNPWNEMMWSALQTTRAVDITTALKAYVKDLWEPQYQRKRVLNGMQKFPASALQFDQSYPTTATMGASQRFSVEVEMGDLSPADMRVDLMAGTLVTASAWHEMRWVNSEGNKQIYEIDATLSEHGKNEFTVCLSPRDKTVFRNGDELKEVTRFVRGHATLVNGVEVKIDKSPGLHGAILQIPVLSFGAKGEDGRATASETEAIIDEVVEQDWGGVYFNGLVGGIGDLNRRMEKNEQRGIEFPYYVEPLNGPRRIFVEQAAKHHKPYAIGSPFAMLDPRDVNRDWEKLAFLVRQKDKLAAYGKRSFVDVTPNHIGLDSPILDKSWDMTVHVDLKELFKGRPDLMEAMKTMDDRGFSNSVELASRGLFSILEHELNSHNLSVFNPLSFYVFYRQPGVPESRILIARAKDPRQEAHWANTVQLDYRNPKARQFVIDTMIFWASRGFDIRADMADLLFHERFRRQWHPNDSWDDFTSVANWPRDFWEEVVEKVMIPYPRTIMAIEAYDHLPELSDTLAAKYPAQYESLMKRLLPYEKDLQKKLVEGHVNVEALRQYLIENPKRNRIVFIQDHDLPDGPWHRGSEAVKAATLVAALSNAHLFVDIRQVHGKPRLESPSTESPDVLPLANEAEMVDFHTNLIAPLQASSMFRDTPKHVLHATPGLLAKRFSVNGYQVIEVSNLTSAEVEGKVFFDDPMLPKNPAQLVVFEDNYFNWRAPGESGRTTVQPAYFETADEIRREHGKYIRLSPNGAHLFFMYADPTAAAQKVKVAVAHAGASGIWKRWRISRHWSLTTIGAIEGAGIILPFIAVFAILMPSGISSLLDIHQSPITINVMKIVSVLAAWGTTVLLDKLLYVIHLIHGVVEPDGSVEHGHRSARAATRTSRWSFVGIIPVAIGFVLGGWLAIIGGILSGLLMAAVFHAGRNHQIAIQRRRQAEALAKKLETVATRMVEARNFLFITLILRKRSVSHGYTRRTALAGAV